jgi:hypothetical protein
MSTLEMDHIRIEASDLPHKTRHHPDLFKGLSQSRLVKQLQFY